MSSDIEFLAHVERSLAYRDERDINRSPELAFLRNILPHLRAASTGQRKKGAIPDFDAYACNADEAARMIEDYSAINLPVFVSAHEIHHWTKSSTPIEQLWGYFGDWEDRVRVTREGEDLDESIQTAQKLFQEDAQVMTVIENVKSTLPPTIPSFLRGPGASLLQKIIFAAQEDGTFGENLQEPLNSQSWITLSTGGLVTPLSMGMFGLGTWIGCQQGETAVAWLHEPDSKKFGIWLEDLHEYHEGQEWRFKVLRPNDTVYMEPGTVFFQFSPIEQENKSFSIGGHVLRNRSVLRWQNMLGKYTHMIASEEEDSRILERNDETTKALLSGMKVVTDAAIRDERQNEYGLSLTDMRIFQTRVGKSLQNFERVLVHVSEAEEPEKDDSFGLTQEEEDLIFGDTGPACGSLLTSTAFSGTENADIEEHGMVGNQAEPKQTSSEDSPVDDSPFLQRVGMAEEAAEETRNGGRKMDAGSSPSMSSPGHASPTPTNSRGVLSGLVSFTRNERAADSVPATSTKEGAVKSGQGEKGDGVAIDGEEALPTTPNPVSKANVGHENAVVSDGKTASNESSLKGSTRQPRSTRKSVDYNEQTELARQKREAQAAKKLKQARKSVTGTSPTASEGNTPEPQDQADFTQSRTKPLFPGLSHALRMSVKRGEPLMLPKEKKRKADDGTTNFAGLVRGVEGKSTEAVNEAMSMSKKRVRDPEDPSLQRKKPKPETKSKPERKLVAKVKSTLHYFDDGNDDDEMV